MFVHARAPFQRRNLAKEWVRMGRTLRFASLVELTHTLLQPFVFLCEITGANLQFFHARTVVRKGSVGSQDMTDTRPYDYWLMAWTESISPGSERGNRVRTRSYTFPASGPHRSCTSGVPLCLHCSLLAVTFVVMRLGKNSRSKFPPTRPARPTAALVKTKCAPRFAWG